MPTLSVVVPVFRDELSIEDNFATLKNVLDDCRTEFSYEIILVNDGSPDNSLVALERIHTRHPDVAGIVNLTRNFGQVPAIIAGMEYCSGDCVVVISSDLQDPPELIPLMFRKWATGIQTVIGTRESREDNWRDRVTSRIFYKLIKRYGLASLPETGFDFFLVDRRVADRLVEIRERNSFLQGQILSFSASVDSIPYQRRRRRIGTSGWTFLKKLKYFADAFAAFSFVPIRFITVLGLLLFIGGIILSATLIVQRIFFGTSAVGWSSVMISMLMLHGIEMLMLGILGEYLWRTLDQVRERPLFMVEYHKLPFASPRHDTATAAGRVSRR